MDSARLRGVAWSATSVVQALTWSPWRVAALGEHVSNSASGYRIQSCLDLPARTAKMPFLLKPAAGTLLAWQTEGAGPYRCPLPVLSWTGRVVADAPRRRTRLEEKTRCPIAEEGRAQR